MSKIKIECKQCKISYEKWPYEIKNYKDIKNYICLICIRSQYIKSNCKFCNKEFQSRIKENKIFCSRSCSASFNNKQRDKSVYICSKTKNSKCSNCGINLIVNVRCSTSNTKCKECKQKNKIKYNKKYKLSKTKEFFCDICNTKFLYYKHSNKKTCSDKCRNIASVGIRTYQNGSRKTKWYFNKYQNKEVLLESSWEVKIAEKLDEKNLKWIRPEPILWYDDKNKKRYYYPDFYLPDFNLYLDPKNPYCMELDKNKLDYFKDRINIVYGNINLILNYIQNLLPANAQGVRSLC